ncbi:hypothetical protein ACLKA6_010973 [Drosophila palustris]
MARPAVEGRILMLNEKNEHDRDKGQRLLKSHWLSDYALDIYKTMKESELRRRPLNFWSTQLDHRPKLIQLCQLVTRTYKLSRCALHLSIYYLDRFMDSYTIRADKLQLAALTCMKLASQIENMDAFVPRYSQMNRFTKDCYTPFEYKAVERKVLTFFKFELIRPTTASFVEMLACRFLAQDDYAAYNKKLDDSPELEDTYPRFNSFEKMLAALAQLLLRMTDYTLNVHRFSNAPPSLLAAACIAAVRQVSGVPKVWTPYLTELTSYTQHMVEPYVDIIILYHYYQTAADVDVQKQSENTWHSPDSGFEEQLSAPQVEVVSVEVETFNIITVQLQKPCKQPPALKRSHLIICEDPESKRLKTDNDPQT